MRDGYNMLVFRWHKIDNFPMIPDLVAFARQWQPDLVIWEPTTYAGAIAAVACGAAHARLMWSVDLFAVTHERYLHLKNQQPPHDRDDAMIRWLAGYAKKYGDDFSEEMITGQFTIDLLPASMRMEAADVRYVPLGYVPYGGRAVVPKWLWEPPARPRIAFSLGISATNRFGGYTVGVQDVLDALADLDIEIVATIADKERHKLTRVPDNTRIVSYVPLHALAPTCAAVIHHAGPGTLRTASHYGVPQLALPWDFDEPELARRLAEQGAGIAIHASEATGARVREAVLRLLTEPSYREAAGRLRAEMHAMPSPNELVGQLEQLTTKHRTR
jgi:glycosyltransferase (activator-dependent family)